MPAWRSGERHRETSVWAEGTNDEDGAQKRLPVSVLFGTNIKLEAAPPYLADGIETRLLRVGLLFYIIPSVEVLLHILGKVYCKKA